MKTVAAIVALVAAVAFAPAAMAQFDVSGDFSVSGKIGIGTDSPAQLLDLSKPGIGSVRFQFSNSEGTAAIQTNDGSLGFRSGGFERMTLNAAGLLGIGTLNPVHRIHLSQLGTSSTRFRLQNGEGYGDFEANDNEIRIRLNDNSVPQFSVNNDGDLLLQGEVSATVIEIRGEAADLAEGFMVNSPKDQIQPGMVVSICPENPGELKLSASPYERTVAGIISGAGDKRVGIQLGHSDEVARGELEPVALTGRVWCWVDADEAGAINPGDMLTTSSTPGHAMKVLDFTRATGSVIGKAMTPLQNGKGLVLVLVSLQ